MPELPDISAYLGALQERIAGQPLEHVRIASPFLLRTARPPITDAIDRKVKELRRIGKQGAQRHRTIPTLESDARKARHLTPNFIGAEN